MSSDVINMAGKTLIVDDIKVLNGSGTSSGAAALAAYKANKANTTAASVSGLLSKVGARKNGSYSIDVYCYNPRKSYSVDYTTDYYVSVGYVICGEATLPLGLTQKYIRFTIPANSAYNGSWVINLYKANEADEAYSVRVLKVDIDTTGNTPRMKWVDHTGNAIYDISNSWMIGSFNFNESAGITEVFISSTGRSPNDYLKSTFMQIMNDASGSNTEDFTDWALAMGCDAIFERLAALEAFISRLYVNNVTVGNGNGSTGFRFRAHAYDEDTKQLLTYPIFDVYNGSDLLFQIDSEHNLVRFGDKFTYNFDTGTLVISNAEMQNVSITQNSNFGGVLAAIPESETEYSISNASVLQAYAYVNYLIGQGLSQDTFYKCSLGDDTTIRYLKFHRNESTQNNETLRQDSMWFYDKDFTLLDIRSLYPDEAKYYELPDASGSPKSYLYTQTLGLTVISTYLDISGLELTVYTGGNKLQLNIPDDITSQSGTLLKRGQLYFNSSTGAVYMSLTAEDPSD